MKCSFCEKDSQYSCNFIPENGDTIIIQGCEQHIQLALSQQNNVALTEEMKQIAKHFCKGSPKRLLRFG